MRMASTIVALALVAVPVVPTRGGQTVITMPAPVGVAAPGADEGPVEVELRPAADVGGLALTRYARARSAPAYEYGGSNGYPLGTWYVGYYPSGYMGPRAARYPYAVYPYWGGSWGWRPWGWGGWWGSPWCGWPGPFVGWAW